MQEKATTHHVGDVALVELGPLPGTTAVRHRQFTQAGLDLLRQTGASFRIVEFQQPVSEVNRITIIRLAAC